ncbi:MAG: nucleotide pyrophosphohydrolase [Promethearchaeota archaeon]
MKIKGILSQAQKIVDEFIGKHGGYWPPLSMIAAIMEELGEVAREVNHLEGHKPKKKENDSEKLGEELGDLLFSVFCLANYYKINLDDQLDKILQKYERRDSKRFS